MQTTNLDKNYLKHFLHDLVVYWQAYGRKKAATTPDLVCNGFPLSGMMDNCPYRKEDYHPKR
jgi:hypothetical protein